MVAATIRPPPPDGPLSCSQRVLPPSSGKPGLLIQSTPVSVLTIDIADLTALSLSLPWVFSLCFLPKQAQMQGGRHCLC